MKVDCNLIEECAIVRGGLHGRPSGNVAGIVYGGARSRQGKVVTARELVFPSNPQTAAQVLQRLKFSQSLFATRHLTAALWQGYFNRSIGQLPGFQSMMSIILNNTDDAEEMGIPADTPLGNLHFPETFTVTTGAGASGSIAITFSAEVGLNGTVDDKIRAFVIAVDASNTDERAVDITLPDVDREDSPFEFPTGLAAEDWICGCFFEGLGTAEGLLSPCKYFAVTSVA
ncbi:MAG: hypothetical protein KAJ51_15140 [Thermoplasmata archaeon]|nr:hypothetical protein [Thermoplasmata archaeon]